MEVEGTVMSDKEKLVELFRAIAHENCFGSIEKIVDYLITNGVTVLTPDEARNVYTVQEIEELQGEAYDLGAESVLHNHFGLSWHDAEGVRKEVAKLQNAPRWIPVTERLPDLIPCSAGTGYSEAVNVLTSGRKVMAAVWDGVDWLCAMDYWGAWGEVITHWTPVLLPLPESPKGE
jgi:hypothetical protein